MQEHASDVKDASSAIMDAARRCLDRFLEARGKLAPRPHVPWMLWVVVAVHSVLGLLILLYPVLLPRQYDGWCMLAISAIMLHWLVFCGECILSVLEKKLLYQSYEMGKHPLHQWYMDVFPLQGSIAVMLLILASWTVALLTLVLRNLKLTRKDGGLFELTWRLWFAGTDYSFLLGAARTARELKAFSGLVHEPFR
jgi:hypothetical protein